MKDQEFINNILEAVESEETATPETRLNDIGWDSLTSMITISIGADMYGKTLKSKDLIPCETFNDIINLLK